MRSRLAVVVMLAVLSVGCAPIYRHETVQDEPLEPLVRDERVADSVQYETEAAIEGERLTLAVEQFETCETVTTPQVHRVRSVARAADSSVTSVTWIVAALGLGGGGFGYLDADNLAAQSSASQTPDQYREASAAAMVIGLGAAVIGVVDALRAADSRYDDGVIAARSRRAEHACERRKTRGVDVSMVIGRGAPLRARLDGNGRATFELSALPAGEVSEAVPPIAVTIGAEHLTVKLAAASWTQLRDTLLADPSSRVAKDMLAGRHARCDELATAARAATPAEPEDVLAPVGAAWQTAKDGCGTLWTGELVAEQAAVERRIADTQCSQRLAGAAGALLSADAASIDGLMAELVGLRRDCTSAPQVAKLEQLDSKLVLVVKQAERAEAAAAKKLAQEEAREARAAQRQQQAEQLRSQNWGNAMLRCNDGTLSPSCTCGRGSYQGCCSHHHGVNSCSADQ